MPQKKKRIAADWRTLWDIMVDNDILPTHRVPEHALSYYQSLVSNFHRMCFRREDTYHRAHKHCYENRVQAS